MAKRPAAAPPSQGADERKRHRFPHFPKLPADQVGIARVASRGRHDPRATRFRVVREAYLEEFAGIGGELERGQRLLWSGRPLTGIRLRREDILFVPATLAWCA